MPRETHILTLMYTTDVLLLHKENIFKQFSEK